MKGARVLLLVAGLLVVVVAGLAATTAFRPIEQPLAFNHRLHVQDLGAECTDCHLHARSGVRATIPNVQLCADCHEEAQTESAAEARLVEHIAAGEPVPWRKVYRVPDDVYFSHRRHTTSGGIACETCHGPVAEQEQPVTRQWVRISMDRCLDCHEDSGVSNDCLWCHR